MIISSGYNVISVQDNVIPVLGNVTPALDNVIPALGKVIPPVLSNVIAIKSAGFKQNRDFQFLTVVFVYVLMPCTRPSAMSTC